jgi:hypothetical protein
MIRTGEFALTQTDYIIVSLLYTLRVWVVFYFLITLVWIILAAASGSLLVLLGLFLWWMGLGLLLLFYFAWHAYSQQNAVIFRRNYYDFDQEYLARYAEDGTTERVRMTSLVKVYRMFNYYMVFTSTTGFFTVPYGVFQSEGDRGAFEGILRAHGLIR